MKKQFLATLFLMLLGTIMVNAQELTSFQQEGTQKFGFKNLSEVVVIPAKYDRVREFSEGLAAVRVGSSSNGKWGFIDITGKEVIPLQYVNAESFSEGLSNVSIGESSFNCTHGYIDKTGKVVIPFEFTTSSSFSEGLAYACDLSKDYQYGFIDKTGKKVIPFKYDYASDFSEGLAPIAKGMSGPETRMWGFVDKSGREVIPIKYHFVEAFNEGRAQVYTESEEFFIDKTGKTVKPFDFIGLNIEGLKVVSKNGKYGFIDKTGKTIIPLKYDGAESFNKGKAKVKLGKETFLIDVNEKRLPEEEADIDYFDFLFGDD